MSLLKRIGLVDYLDLRKVIIGRVSELATQVFSIERELLKLAERREIIWPLFKKRKKLFYFSLIKVVRSFPFYDLLILTISIKV